MIASSGHNQHILVVTHPVPSHIRRARKAGHRMLKVDILSGWLPVFNGAS